VPIFEEPACRQAGVACGTSMSALEDSASPETLRAILSTEQTTSLNQTNSIKMTEDSKQRKIFLSYSSNDKDKAMVLANKLMDTGFEVVSDYKNIPVGKNAFDEIKYLFQSSDFVLVLLSKSLFQSEYFKFEYTKDFFNQTQKRKITLIPVLIEKCDIPSDFLEYEIFNLISNYDKGLEKLLRKIKTIPEVSFEKLSPREFEELVSDLLKAYGFINIKHESKFGDTGIDMVAEYISRNPFGQKKKELWMVETKFYSRSRFDLITIRKLIGQYKYINKVDAKLLLITNSQFTSAVEDFLEVMRESNSVDVEVVDGLTLKKLIADKPHILNKYFLK
jgi:hypothetical protein